MIALIRVVPSLPYIVVLPALLLTMPVAHNVQSGEAAATLEMPHAY
jgi:hypothetical protein